MSDVRASRGAQPWLDAWIDTIALPSAR